MAIIATAAVSGRTRKSILTGLGTITGDFVWLGLVLLALTGYTYLTGRAA
jgi:threonine/homoserine/homoserine lactone efflux protein